MSFYDKNMQKGRSKQHTKAKGSETGNRPQRVQGLQEGSGDVRKTTPMPEKKKQHGEKMACLDREASVPGSGLLSRSEVGGEHTVQAP